MRGKKNVFGEIGYTNIVTLEDAIKDTNMASKVDELGLGSEEFKLAGLPRSTCSGCQQPKIRIAKKTPKKSTRKFYEDENGAPWNGLKCPECTRSKAKNFMKEKRAKKKLEPQGDL